uniref:Protein kinase domain-containing protein n=1 Tax=Acrobeloides nanus TaxID=290746 RepID=A0A914CDZ4_9BILA
MSDTSFNQEFEDNLLLTRISNDLDEKYALDQLYKCEDLQYGVFVGHRIECNDCHPACIDGCQGPDSVVSSNGCKRCKYGSENDDQKTCLNIKSESNLICKSGYFLDKANEQESNWTENICRPCHSACISCISSGPSPEKDTCICKEYELIDYRDNNNKICSNKCPSDNGFTELPNLNKTSVTTCIRCEEDGATIDPQTKSCIPKDYKYLFWIFIASSSLLATICCIWYGIRRKLMKTGLLCCDSYSVKYQKNRNHVNHESQISYDSKRTNTTLVPMEEIHLMPKQIKQWDNFYILEHHLKYKEDANHLIGRGNFGPVYKIKWRWLALECLDDESKYTQKSDIWSYGVTCWEIFTYCEVEPYETVKNVKDLKKCLESNQYLPKPALCDNFTFNKIKRCWAKDINERPNFEELYFYFFDIGNKMREGRKVVINPNQNKTTEILSNSNETTSTSILGKNETALQKDEKNSSNKESIHGYINLAAAEQVLRIEEGRQKSKIEDPNKEIEDNTRRSNQEKSSHSEPKERTNPDILIDVTSSYINLSKDSVPNDPDPKISSRVNNNENQLVKIRQEKPNKILDAFLSEILYEVPKNLLSRKCKLIFPDIHDFTFDLHNIHEIRDIASSVNGSVKESLHVETTRKLATKSIRIPSYRRGDEKQSQRLKKLLQEIQHHLTLIDSPNIVQLYGYCCCSKDLVLVMELMTTDLKSLYKKVHEKENMFPEDLIGCVGVAVTDALAFSRKKLTE